MKKIRKRIFEIIQSADDGDTASRIFDIFIIALIVLNVILVMLDTFSLPDNIRSVFSKIELFSVVIFTLEYVLRIWTSVYLYPGQNPFASRIRYIFSFMAMIDLAAILPFYIPFVIPVDLRVLRILRVVRLFRIFKINRYTSALQIIGRVFKNKASQLLSSMFVVFMLIIIASVLMYNIESASQPDNFQNVFQSMWWAIATFTTVGYGDIYPVTAAGKILSAIIAFLGIGLVAVPTGIISAGFIESMSESDAGEKKQYCPYCGKKLND